MEDQFKKLQTVNLVFAVIFAVTSVLQIIREIMNLLKYGEKLSTAPSSFYVIFLGCLILDGLLIYFAAVFYKRSKVGIPSDRDEKEVLQRRSRAFRSMVFTTVMMWAVSVPVRFFARGLMDALIYSANSR